ncbi:MAG: hypothetical protein RLP97_01345 [Coleofasciculus chthonoplastes F2-STO-03]
MDRMGGANCSRKGARGCSGGVSDDGDSPENYGSAAKSGLQAEAKYSTQAMCDRVEQWLYTILMEWEKRT